MELRDYQQDVIDQVYEAWNSGYQSVMVQLATGGGKTVIFSQILADNPGISVAIAHRVELVSQMSLTLARYGIRHNIIASHNSVRSIVTSQMQEFGKCYYDPQARRHVIGVDTLIRMCPRTPWFGRVSVVIQDEGHHVLKTNKWGKAAALFPNANGLYPTATPCRADGRGLGKHADGIIDHLIIGVPMRELITRGYLTDYRIFAPPSDLDLSRVTMSAGGDYSPPKLRTAVHKSHITGDVVSHYLRIAPDKLGVTFAVDIQAATEIAAAFRAAGIKSEVISSKTPDLLRANIMRKFRNREIMQLVNVDLLGEGVDVPAIECISFARPTASYTCYSQQFGRALRPLPGKTHALIIDHVGNVIRHGLPDASRIWSLDRRGTRAKSTLGDIPLRTCLNPECVAVYPRIQRTCPYCGHYNVPANRSSPEQVEGDLFELDPEVLATLRGEIVRIESAPRIPHNATPIVRASIIKNHKERQEAQRELRHSIAVYAGYLKHAGRSDSEIYRMFYHAFGVDIATAQTLNAGDAANLKQRIDNTRNIQ